MTREAYEIITKNYEIKVIAVACRFSDKTEI